jgi:hypothetical protein
VTELLRAWSPWSPADGLRWVAVGALGHVLVLVAWWLTASEEAFDAQVRWATLATAGFAIVSYADISWVLHARFSLIQRREALLPTVPIVNPPVMGSADAEGNDDRLVGGAGLGRYHRASCPMARQKDWPPLDRSVALAEGRRPCGVCAP